MQAQDRGRRGALGSAPCCAHGRLLSRRIILVLVSVHGCFGCITRATTHETWSALRRECRCARAIARITAQHTFTLKRKTKSSSTAALVRGWSGHGIYRRRAKASPLHASLGIAHSSTILPGERRCRTPDMTNALLVLRLLAQECRNRPCHPRLSQE